MRATPIVCDCDLFVTSDRPEFSPIYNRYREASANAVLFLGKLSHCLPQLQTGKSSIRQLIHTREVITRGCVSNGVFALFGQTPPQNGGTTPYYTTPMVSQIIKYFPWIVNINSLKIHIFPFLTKKNCLFGQFAFLKLRFFAENVNKLWTTKSFEHFWPVFDTFLNIIHKDFKESSGKMDIFLIQLNP